MDIGGVSIISAFIAGLLTFLAPCTLPLVPAYLGFISGVDEEELKNPETQRAARLKIIKNGLLFMLGFAVVFVLFGALAGLLGQALAPFRVWLARIGGVFIVFFGLFMLGVLKIPQLSGEYRFTMPKMFKAGNPFSSFFVGATFALGWTPCVGPILGSILFLASSSTDVLGGTLLLLVFSVGLAVPFLLVSIGYAHATAYIAKLSGYLNIISRVGGVFLIVLGILLATDQFGLTIEYGYRLLDGFNYERLLDYL